MHHLHTKKDTDLIIKFDTTALSPAQTRLIKTMNALMAHVVSADEESELFEGSAELMIKMSELIQHSTFAQTHKDMKYAEQAIEYSMDFLRENLESLLHTNLDN